LRWSEQRSASNSKRTGHGDHFPNEWPTSESKSCWSGRKRRTNLGQFIDRAFKRLQVRRISFSPDWLWHLLGDEIKSMPSNALGSGRPGRDEPMVLENKIDCDCHCRPAGAVQAL
jgi:hypothetical protein